MEDFTTLILKSSIWFFVGLLLYYTLTLIKVHLLWYVQPKMFVADKPMELLNDYFTKLFATIKKSPVLFRQVFQYLFHYDKVRFMVADDERVKPIKKRINILEGFTTFLKPFIIFSIVWIIIKVWIYSKFMYNPLTISLGKIQLLLNEIKEIPAIQFINNHKAVIFLTYTLVCILIPVLYNREEKTKKIKKYFSQYLIYLSLCLNISFFGAKSGTAVNASFENLVKLEAEVDSIHNQIFKNSFNIVVLKDVEESILNDDDKLDSINGLYKEGTLEFIKLSSDSESSMINELKRYHDELYANTKLDYAVEGNLQKIVIQKNYSSLNYFTNAFSDKASNENSYFGNKKEWNKSTGQKLLTAINEEKDKLINGTSSKRTKILSKFIDAIFDFGLDETLSSLFKSEVGETLGIKGHKTLKKLSSLLLSEEYKQKICSRFVDMVDKKKIIPKPDYSKIINEKVKYKPFKNTELTAINNANFNIINKLYKEKITTLINNIEVLNYATPELTARAKATYEKKFLFNYEEAANTTIINNKLKENLSIMTEIIEIAASENASGKVSILGYRICPKCFMPAIPGTPCIRIGRR